MKHYASRRFWALYQELPEHIRKLADEKYQLLKADPHHPSLHFKRIGKVWSVRAGQHYRALGHDVPDGIQWFWIGTHAEYEKLSANNAMQTDKVKLSRLLLAQKPRQLAFAADRER